MAVEEEAIKDLRTDSEAKRHKHVTIIHAEAAAQEVFIKDIKKAEAEQQVATSHAKKQLILAEASMEASDKEARAAIRVAVRALPDMYAGVIVLHYLEGLGVKEIAERLSMPVGTVKIRLHRGRAVLREKLERFGRPS